MGPPQMVQNIVVLSGPVIVEGFLWAQSIGDKCDCDAPEETDRRPEGALLLDRVDYPATVTWPIELEPTFDLIWDDT